MEKKFLTQNSPRKNQNQTYLLTSCLKRLLFILTINKNPTIMNTKTAQEIFREKHKDILTSLNELRISYSSSVVAFIIIIICTTLGILSTGNKLVFFLIILIFVVASTILELRSFFKNRRYLKEHKEHLIAMEADLCHIVDTEDFKEIKKLINFYDKL